MNTIAEDSTTGERLRIGLVGTGYWAEQCHAAGIERRDDLDFVGVWGRNPLLASEFAARHSITAFDDYRELFDSVDIVSFAVPPTVQAELAPLAADSGCHLLLEKPTAVSPREAQAIADACTRNGVRSVVNFSTLLAASSGEWMRDIVGASNWDGGGVSILGDLRVADTPFSDSPWRRSDTGALWDVGPHALSVLVSALGPVEDVRAQHGHGDAFVLSLLHRGGAVSSVRLCFSLGLGAGDFGIEFWGEAGRVVFPTGEPSPASTPADSIAPALALLVDAIRDGREIRVDASFGAEITRVLSLAESNASDNKTTSQEV